MRKLSPLLIALALTAHAEVKTPLLFSDHMILQRDHPVKIWGWADPGEVVNITFGPSHATATAAPDGTWLTTLPSMPANATPQTLTISGKNTLTFQDVLVGDIWVCSGQSNMERSLQFVDYTDADLATANDPGLRIFRVVSRSAISPQADFQPWNGKQWMVGTPKDVLSFSAVGFYFGRELRKDLKIPIGLMDSSQGGSMAQLWVSLQAIQKNVNADYDFRGWLEQHDELVADYPQRLADYPAAKVKYDQDLKQYNQDLANDKAYSAQLATWQAAFDQAAKDGTPRPQKPKPPRPAPKEPQLPDGGPFGNFMVGNLYNSMINPMINFTIKGILWYQGESNGGAGGKQYRVLLPILINDWRTRWGQGDIPFFIVQLPNINAPQKLPVQPKDPWVALRESQAHALTLPNTAMATTIDIGDPYNVHGKDKKDIGYRLSLIARHNVYGENIVYEGPTYKSMSVEGKKISLTFDHTGSGLTIGAAPWSPTGVLTPVASELKGFAIAGPDHKFFWAKATIAGDHVIVSSDEVPHPVAVRYGWADNPPCNLYNKEKLPATPFRTDDWDL
jgi:sialate O-acetylesterase